MDLKGNAYRVTIDWQLFPSYEKAVAYISSQKSGNHRIASRNEFVSPLPLEALKSYRLIYSSDDGVMQSVGLVPTIKIFEYVK